MERAVLWCGDPLGRLGQNPTDAVVCYGIPAGIVAPVKTQKVTVHVDRDLLRRARKRTGKGVSATVRHGLELVAATEAYEQLRALRGKVAFSLDLADLREDRP